MLKADPSLCMSPVVRASVSLVRPRPSGAGGLGVVFVLSCQSCGLFYAARVEVDAERLQDWRDGRGRVEFAVPAEVVKGCSCGAPAVKA